MIDWAEAVDSFYKGHQLLPEVVRVIGTALLGSMQGQSAEQIAKQLDLQPQQVREIVIRAKGWEYSLEQTGG